ncbi:MAG: MFS transporter [Spirochaetales bacterium]|nr:MFS transporter [Spirochaetales bacterium]
MNFITILEKEQKKIYFISLFMFFLFGTIITFISSSIPTLLREFDWSYTNTGIILAAGSLGYFLSTFAAGFLLKKMGPKMLLAASLTLYSAGLAFYMFFPIIILNVFLGFLFGTGKGATDISINFITINIEEKGKSRLMNFLHAFFCIGAITGPLLFSLVHSLEGNFHYLFPVFAIICFLMGMLYLSTPFKGTGERKAVPGQGKISKKIILLLVMLTGILMLYVGSEIGVTTWISEYFVSIFHFSVEQGGYIVSLFWLGIFTGRTLISLLYKGDRQERLLLILTILCATGVSLLLLLNNPVGSAVFTFVAGLGYSGIYPLVISTTGKHFTSSRALGFVVTGGGLGSFTFPLFIAAISDKIGLNHGFIFFLAINIVLVLMAGFVFIFSNRQKA